MCGEGRYLVRQEQGTCKRCGRGLTAWWRPGAWCCSAQRCDCVVRRSLWMGGQWHGWDVLETVRSARRLSRDGTRETQVKSEYRHAQHRDPQKLEDGVICRGCVWKQLAAAGHGHVFTLSWGCLGSTLFLIGPTGSPDMQGGSVTCAMSCCLDFISVPSCPAVFSPWAVGRWRPGVAFRTKERRKLGALPLWGTGALPPHPSVNCPILPPFYLPPLGKPVSTYMSYSNPSGE